jgi:hypothetical protein
MKRTETLLLAPITKLPSKLSDLLDIFIELHDSVAEKDRDSIRILTESVATEESFEIITSITCEREETELETAQRIVREHVTQKDLEDSDHNMLEHLMHKYPNKVVNFIGIA